MLSPDHFAPRLLAWQRAHGRHDLPWQRTRDPYRIWLSEIMLQQTQVATVMPYYARFLARCPDVASLAAAPADDVMALWSGLGYYSRARNLHRCAQDIMSRFGGAFPDNVVELETLPGIGRSTAAAIAAFAFDAHEAILDGNVKRVLARVFGVDGFPGEKAVETAMWTLAESLLPAASRPSPVISDSSDSTAATSDISAYTQGMMDLGATLCTRANPACTRCPFAADCVAHLTGRERELPVRKPKKAVPIRQTVMLVLEAGPYLLLHRRPPSGIWGGLWSLPEAPDDTVARRLAQSFNAQPETFSALTPFVHVFTHFRLEISPLRALCPEPQGGNLPGFDDAHLEWVAWRELDRYGLPAPVKKVLDGLRGSLL